MDSQTLALLCDPLTREPLEMGGGKDSRGRAWQFLWNPRSGKRFAIRDGIPIFTDLENLAGRNRQFRKLYDRVVVFYDVQSHIYAFLSHQNLRELRSGFLAQIEIRPGDRVLEVSVGTAWNLRLLPEGIDFYGLDLSWGMLQKGRRNLRRSKRQARLFCGEGEHLPFRDGSFDVVFQLGGLNFFNDRKRAILEMIRVARPGTSLLISDENEKQIRELYRRIPILGRRLWSHAEGLAPPLDLIPPGMVDPVVRDHGGGRFYTLTFCKPD
ncbi:MAG TPA: methyltransferase domain-containing protein [Candidatus Dormibacteraeota bacterium]|nr:methyltransferase domain-containing protein [Candidatus Dormibacteraeota bacterium]